MRLVALLIAAAPVVFGAMRLVSTGNDYRYLLTAIASLAAAATVYGYGAATAGGMMGLFSRPASAQ